MFKKCLLTRNYNYRVTILENLLDSDVFYKVINLSSPSRKGGGAAPYVHGCF